MCSLKTSRFAKYYSVDQIEIRWAGHVTRIGHRRGTYKIFGRET
jgi:hypothetical protein